MSNVLPCRCGLPYEDVRELRLFGPNGLCTAEGADGNPCGQRLADHPHRPAAVFHSWIGSVFFLFISITNPSNWKAYTLEFLRGELASRNLPVTGSKSELIPRLINHIATGGPGILEIVGTAFAITPRRFISCQHNIYDENYNMTYTSVVICSSILKIGSRMVPHPLHPTFYGDLHVSDATLDYAIFNLRLPFPDLVPIPICPVQSLPTPGVVSLTIYFGAIGDFAVSELRNLSIWRGGPHSVLQYGESSATDPEGCKLLTEHGLCRGSSGGAIVMNGYVVGMHLASVSQGRYMWKLPKNSSLSAEQLFQSVTDMQDLYSAFKEGLVLCHIPQIMDAVNNP